MEGPAPAHAAVGLLRHHSRSTRYVVKYGAGDYEEIDVNAADAVLIVEVPPAIPCLIVNTGDEDGWVINMPHPAWPPDDRDDHAVSYDDYPDWPRYSSR